MFTITVTLSLIVLAQARKEKETCSGIDTSSFPDFRFTDLGRNYNSFFFVDTENKPSDRPLAPQIRFTFGGPKSNKAVISADGTLPEKGGCLIWGVVTYQRFQNRPCITERLTTPVTCTDEDEWLYYPFAADKLIFYFCASFKADGSCDRKLIRGVSTKNKLSPADVEAFRDAFNKFGVTLPEMSDPLNNDCQKIIKAKADLEEAARRFGKGSKSYYKGA